MRYFSAPGRVEICGNHTDHQCGCVLAAAVNLEATAAAKVNGLSIVRMRNTQFDPADIDISVTDVRDGEKGTPASIVRGVAVWFRRNGYDISGFDAEVSSAIPIGAGLSSSAAYGVLIGNVFKGLFGSSISKIEIARAAQFAENVYSGKPCGLMDQAASSFGGLNLFDFQNPEKPIVTPVRADIEGYLLCVVATGGSHENLVPDYAAIPYEMGAVAEYFGKKHLREVPEEEFRSSIGRLRFLGDRAVLRAVHFFSENKRVLDQAAALNRGDIRTFFDLIIESGRSSLACLQNVYSPASPKQQGLTLALALSEKILAGRGAWRVNGGGFAGTILAFMPEDAAEEYEREMSDVFGEGCCRFLNIRNEGGGELPERSE